MTKDSTEIAGDGTVLVSILSGAVSFALSRGLTMAEVEKLTGVSGQDLMEPDDRVPEMTMPKLWNALAAREPDRALPIDFARAAPVTLCGGLTHGMQFANTLREALSVVVRNRIVLAENLKLMLVDTPELQMMTGRHHLDHLDQGRSTEAGVGILYRVVHEVLEIRDAVERVEFAYGAKGPVSAYQDFFGVPVIFNRPVAAMVFRPGALDQTIRHANAELFAFVTQHFNDLVQRIEQSRQPPGLSKLRKAIAENAARGEFRPTAAAVVANMSHRSAQRLAANYGTTLSAMIEGTRKEAAMSLLQDPSTTVRTVADIMGFSDDRAFRRAFHRWTGKTPSAFRRDVLLS